VDVVELCQQCLPGGELADIVLERIGTDLACDAPRALDVDIGQRDAIPVRVQRRAIASPIPRAAPVTMAVATA